MVRSQGRKNDQLRPVNFTLDYIDYPEGSVLISVGKTRVLCNVSLEKGVPPWMENPDSSRGWITAEYALLPRSTTTRVQRETRGFSGRTQEIKRLIGRSLRAAFDLNLLGERTFIVDCDVLQADGGTRTASITGGYVALCLALNKLVERGEVSPAVFLPPVAAISVGILAGKPVLDLDYEEDSQADVDLNVVMNQAGEYIEIQGTSEGATFSRQDLDTLLAYAATGIQQLITQQAIVLG
ncbi:MAG: ribonuclease PH [Anaerolineales bacterium]